MFSRSWQQLETTKSRQLFFPQEGRQSENLIRFKEWKVPSQSHHWTDFLASIPLLVFFVNTWCSTTELTLVQYQEQKILQRGLIAASMRYISAISGFVRASIIIIKKSPNSSASLIKNHWPREVSQHLPLIWKAKSFPHCDLYPRWNPEDVSSWLQVSRSGLWCVQAINIQTDRLGPTAPLPLGPRHVQYRLELRAISVSWME